MLLLLLPLLPPPPPPQQQQLQLLELLARLPWCLLVLVLVLLQMLALVHVQMQGHMLVLALALVLARMKRQGELPPPDLKSWPLRRVQLCRQTLRRMPGCSCGPR